MTMVLVGLDDEGRALDAVAGDKPLAPERCRPRATRRREKMRRVVSVDASASLTSDFVSAAAVSAISAPSTSDRLDGDRLVGGDEAELGLVHLLEDGAHGIEIAVEDDVERGVGCRHNEGAAWCGVVTSSSVMPCFGSVPCARLATVRPQGTRWPRCFAARAAGRGPAGGWR